MQFYPEQNLEGSEASFVNSSALSTPQNGPPEHRKPLLLKNFTMPNEVLTSLEPPKLTTQIQL